MDTRSWLIGVRLVHSWAERAISKNARSVKTPAHRVLVGIGIRCCAILIKRVAECCNVTLSAESFLAAFAICPLRCVSCSVFKIAVCCTLLRSVSFIVCSVLSHSWQHSLLYNLHWYRQFKTSVYRWILPMMCVCMCVHVCVHVCVRVCVCVCVCVCIQSSLISTIQNQCV